MKNNSIALILLLASSISFAQVQSGINTKTPTTTLEVVANGADNTVLDGITIPKLTCAQIVNKQANAVPSYGADQTGTIVYITDISGLCSNPPVTEVVTKGIGFYVFNGTEFIKVALDAIQENPNWSLSGNPATDSSTDFIGTTDAQDLAIRTNDTERVRVLATGNIGIGTTTPTTTLQVAGQPTDGLIADGLTIPSLTGANLALKNLNTTYTASEIGTLVYITAAAPSPLAAQLTENVTSAGLFYFDGTTWQRVSNSSNSWSIEGNLGTDATTDFIGTKDAQDLVFKTNSEDIGNTSIDEEVLRLTVDNEAIVTGKSLGTNITNEDFPVSGVNDPVDMLRIQATVFDGVGDIENNVLRTYFRRQAAGLDWTETNLRTQKLVDIGGTYTKQGFIDYGIDGVASSAGLGFGSGTTTHMVVQQNGNVGIGTTTPTTDLEVVGDANDILKADGITIPKITGDQLSAKNTNSAYGAPQTGTLMYVSAATTAPTPAELTENVVAAGLYYFDGATWQVTAKHSVGDIKQGFQIADHGGWVLLDGRDVTMLSTTQQAAFAAMFPAGTNLPQTSGGGQNSATYLADIDGNPATVGDLGGNDDNLWGAGDLPDLNHAHEVDPPNTTSGKQSADHHHNYTFNSNFQVGYNANPASSVQFMRNVASTAKTGNQSSDHTHNTNIPQFNSANTNPGGANSNVPTAPRTLDVNTFIYLGN